MKQCTRFGPAVWFTFILVVAFAGSPAMAQTPQPFSADFSSTSPTSGTKTGKWFSSPPKMRVEMTMPQDSGPYSGDVTMIIDGKTHAGYVLMPQAHMYMEIQPNGARDEQGMRNLESLSRGGDLCAGNPGSTCKKVGTETVNGRSCDKWEMVDKTKHKAVIWVDQKLYAAVRLQEDDGTITNLTNVKEGAQSASLFEVPAGYHKFDPNSMGGSR